MRECAECLCPDDPEVPCTSAVDFCENTIEDVAKKMSSKASNHRLASSRTVLVSLSFNGRYGMLTSDQISS